MTATTPGGRGPGAIANHQPTNTVASKGRNVKPSSGLDRERPLDGHALPPLDRVEAAWCSPPDLQLSTVDVAVLAYMLTKADSATLECRRSQADIAAALRCGRRSVKASWQRLRSCGVMRRRQRFQQTAVSTFDADVLRSWLAAARARYGDVVPVSSSEEVHDVPLLTDRGAPRAPLQTQEGHHVPQEGHVVPTIRVLCPGLSNTESGSAPPSATPAAVADATSDLALSPSAQGNQPASKRKRFHPPTVADVAAYCRELGCGIDPEYFVDYYQSLGWRRGKTPVKDWKATLRTWAKRERPSDRAEVDQPSAASAFGWHPDDVRHHQDDDRWGDYCLAQTRAAAEGRRGPWQRFASWSNACNSTASSEDIA